MTGRVDEDWLEGSLQGQTGLFPANFIDNVPSGLSQVGKEGVGSPTVQQSGVDSKSSKVRVGVAQYKGVWCSTRGCGSVQGGVTQYNGVWHSMRGHGTVQGGVAQYKGV